MNAAARPQREEKDGDCAADTNWLAAPPMPGRLASHPPTVELIRSHYDFSVSLKFSFGIDEL